MDFMSEHWAVDRMHFILNIQQHHLCLGQFSHQLFENNCFFYEKLSIAHELFQRSLQASTRPVFVHYADVVPAAVAKALMQNQHLTR